jgi:acetyl esterase
MDPPAEAPPRTGPIDRNRELLKLAREETYKMLGDTSLSAWMWMPETPAEQAVPVVAFFYSSGWDHGQISQFAPHCVYFASRGMLAVAFDYRVSSRHGTGPLEAIEDAQDAVRWLRLNAAELGINPSQIIGAGGTGGAHAIAAAALLAPPPDKRGVTAEDLAAVPDGLVLFNPVLDTSKKGYGMDRFPDPASAKKHNLISLIRKKLPPTLILHGASDRVVPVAGSRIYAKKASRKRNICQLVEFGGVGHGFFNFNVSFAHYEATLVAMDDFLVSLGIIQPENRLRDAES